MDMQMEELLGQYRDLAERYAPAKATREYIDEYKKSLLALLMKDAERNGATSNAAQERDARARGEYLEMLDKLRLAIEEEEKLRYHLKATEIQFEMWRTKEATARAERRMYGA